MTRDTELGFGYPTSAMGGMAFLRQTLLDAQWYQEAQEVYRESPQGMRRPETDRSLESLGPVVAGQVPAFFRTTSEEELLRAARIAAEFDLPAWYRGSGTEYRMLEEVAALGAPVVLPVSFPSAPNLSDPAATLGVSLGQLRHWYLAPENPGRLANAGVTVALTAQGLNDPSTFPEQVRVAVDRGLDPTTALAAVTTTPAEMLGIGATHGTLAAGKVANLVVADGDLFTENARIHDVWVDGVRHEIHRPASVDPRGRWTMTSASPAFTGDLVLQGQPGRLSGSFERTAESTSLSNVSLAQESRRLGFHLPGDVVGMEGTVRLTATVAGETIHGWGELPDGSRASFQAQRVEGPSAGSGPDSRGVPASLDLRDIRPSQDHGREGLPEQPSVVLVRNATLWTMGPDGLIEGGDLLVREGRIEAVGQNLDAPSDAVIVDADGAHVTPGLIDAHLHSGISGGVNETGNAIVPEVWIGDVLTMNNTWMYRQLAGGLTTAHVMHGSANPIGGQNAFVKMRWGASTDEIVFEDAPRTVKFALGENVTRNTNRYPNTRQGVKEIIRDNFRAAREYEAEWARWEESGDGIPPRRDLRMEALVDILNEDISIQSHSYRQDEIFTLMHLAEEFDTRIKAFHHGVEAFKVAPELAAHGAGAVIWSDWSGFKVESYDATTYNARILMDAGVVTSLHSDNSQIASRMNWEAAKMLRTGLTEEEALSLVTSNTAVLLGIDDRVGSLEPGKDADFVIWTDHPLSMAAGARQTWIDGRKYFDLEDEQQDREATEQERARLIQFILDNG
ncbi:MAG: amidohydrolase [Gemmatimonadales bacterium]|nr:MAG: amidohydrolase [Gemmatimonadales bacterium]